MSLYIVNIHGNIEGDYEIVRKYKEQESVLDKIRAEIERQEKWLLQAGYNEYNVDIAFDAIRLVAESEETDADSN